MSFVLTLTLTLTHLHLSISHDIIHIVGATPFVDSGWPHLLKWVQHLLILWPILLKWWPILLILWPTLLIWNYKMGIFIFWVATFCVNAQNVDSGIEQNQQSLSFLNLESTNLVIINLESTICTVDPFCQLKYIREGWLWGKVCWGGVGWGGGACLPIVYPRGK